MSKIIIKGTKNSKSHFIGARQVRESIDKDGGKVIEADEPYLGSRFPGTVQQKRIKWSNNQKKWLLDMSPEELNAFVKKCNLKYLEGAKAGLPIETADIRNEYDSFFTHKLLNVALKSGMAVMESEYAKDAVLIKGFESDRAFSSKHGPQAINTRYYIVNENNDKEEDSKNISSEIEAIAKLASLSDIRKRSIATALNLGVNEKTETAIILKVLSEYIKNNKYQLNGKTSREIFMELANENAEQLKIKELITKSKKLAILRYSKSSGFIYKGDTIAETQENLETLLKTDSALVSELLDAIAEKE